VKSYTDAYADGDTIPGVVPSTEREGGSPALNGIRRTTQKLRETALEGGNFATFSKIEIS